MRFLHENSKAKNQDATVLLKAQPAEQLDRFRSFGTALISSDNRPTPVEPGEQSPALQDTRLLQRKQRWAANSCKTDSAASAEPGLAVEETRRLWQSRVEKCLAV